MKNSNFNNKLRLFLNKGFKKNNLNLKNLKLLLNSLFFFIVTSLRRERNIASEIYSYENLFFVKLKDPINFLESCRKNDHAFDSKIREEVFKLKKHFNVDILDTLEIGSGPNSNLSYWVDKGIIKVIAIDPLADTYKKIMVKLNYRYPIVPIKLRGEDLMEKFEKERFHIVFAQNSLDHTENPIKCFENGYYLLKKGGLYFICSNIKEGTRTAWSGLHKYDIFIENKELFLSNQKGEIYRFINKNLCTLELIFYEEYERIKGVPSFEVVYRKI